ncbi:apolipoprotein N-acyltransferase [Mucilaginibacter terrenus]|uniref:Apolipoprotein N-acyltransferase n=1 Tax=Mucilaginibacter terrenus TaxID=2482727 RepID=A0A3E2NLG5_9SPHI|nr:apolipoprotein N-acyltransferase [Mucilaginibacter terrenus]RFZ81811.1 apolipoprotein N-acyltransferase [Mucilaginibacter terrenus]
MKRNTILPVISGLLLWLAWPPTPYTTILLFIGLVPMLVVMEDIINSDVPKKGKQIFNKTFLGFFIWNVLCIYWVYNSLKIVGAIIAIPISLIPYALGPLLMSTACWLYYRLRLRTTRTIGLIGLVCFWIAYEYLHQSWDLNFPWMTLGNGFAVSHQWVQWYEFTGVYGGTIWVWAVNILVFLAYLKHKQSQQKQTWVKPAIAAALAFLLPQGISLYRYYSYEEQVNPSNVVVVQPNIDPYLKQDIPATKQIEELTHLSDSVAQPNTEFFIWPETAISEYIDEDRILNSNHYLQVRQFLNKYKNGNVITGGETYRVYDKLVNETASPMPNGGFWDNYSTAINIENSQKVQFYHKSRLVPGAESLPFQNALFFLKPVFAHLGGATGNYTMQAEPGVFYSQSGIGAAPVICYESIWGEWVAKSVKSGAQFIAIITNDGWWENTSGKDQHMDYAKLRAIETRRWVCRSANTGISAFINQRGDVVKHSSWWVRSALKQDINLNSDITFYVEYGDYLPKAGTFLALLGIAFVIMKGIFRKRIKI